MPSAKTKERTTNCFCSRMFEVSLLLLLLLSLLTLLLLLLSVMLFIIFIIHNYSDMLLYAKVIKKERFKYKGRIGLDLLRVVNIMAENPSKPLSALSSPPPFFFPVLSPVSAPFTTSSHSLSLFCQTPIPLRSKFKITVYPATPVRTPFCSVRKQTR